MGYDRSELATIGERFAPEVLIEWAGDLVRSAKRDAERLRRRGITGELLEGVEHARNEVAERLVELDQAGWPSPPRTAVVESAVEIAIDWRDEVRGLAH